MPTYPPPNPMKTRVRQKALTAPLLIELAIAFLVVLPDFFRIWEQKLLNFPMLCPLTRYKAPSGNPETILHVCTRA